MTATSLVFVLLGSVLVVLLAGAVVAVSVPPQRLRHVVAASGLIVVGLLATLAVTWTQLPSND